MSEVQEKVWIVMRRLVGDWGKTPVKAFDDRSDARTYAARMEAKSRRHVYSATGIKKG